MAAIHYFITAPVAESLHRRLNDLSVTYSMLGLHINDLDEEVGTSLPLMWKKNENSLSLVSQNNKVLVAETSNKNSNKS